MSTELGLRITGVDAAPPNPSRRCLRDKRILQKTTSALVRPRGTADQLKGLNLAQRTVVVGCVFVFYLPDQLHRGDRFPNNINEPLDVAQHEESIVQYMDEQSRGMSVAASRLSPPLTVSFGYSKRQYIHSCSLRRTKILLVCSN